MYMTFSELQMKCIEMKFCLRLLKIIEYIIRIPTVWVNPALKFQDCIHLKL